MQAPAEPASTSSPKAAVHHADEDRLLPHVKSFVRIVAGELNQPEESLWRRRDDGGIDFVANEVAWMNDVTRQMQLVGNNLSPQVFAGVSAAITTLHRRLPRVRALGPINLMMVHDVEAVHHFASLVSTHISLNAQISGAVWARGFSVDVLAARAATAMRFFARYPR